jgi:F-type H+-transporting ATPase subunit b
MMKKRSDKIKDELDDAAKSQEDAAALKEEYENKLKDIDKEAEKILSDARKRALENENKIVANAKEEAAAIIERARTEAELEKQKAADDMKREMVVLASMMAGKVVKASIDTTVQESLINDTLKEIGESTWQS